MDGDDLTHLDDLGRARMVDVSAKPPSRRSAVARARLRMRPDTLRRIVDGDLPKGDVLATARVAGTMAAKRTSDLIPLCHPLPLSAVRVAFRREESEEGLLEVESAVQTVGRTGAEMEALVAASVAALTVYDMCKAVDRGMTVEAVRLVAKSGGRSGTYRRPGEPEPLPGGEDEGATS